MIAVACDHGGFYLKKAVMGYLDEKVLPYKDLGMYDAEAADYPEYGAAAARAVLSGECDRGIIICGTGIGISIAANRFKGIRAALCGDVFSAKAARSHNDANILALGGRVLGQSLALEILEAFLNTPFSGGERHARRIKAIDN